MSVYAFACVCVCASIYVCVNVCVCGGPRLILVFLDCSPPYILRWGVSHLNSTLPDTACFFSHLALGDLFLSLVCWDSRRGHSPFDRHTVLGIHALVLVLMWKTLYPASCLYPGYYVYGI